MRVGSVAFIPSRAAGLDRLMAFQGSMGLHYTRQRNHDFGPDDRSNLSCLSPWVRSRLVEERELVEAALSAHSPSAADKFVKEVCWRTYWKGWLEHRPAVWQSYRAEAGRQLAALHLATANEGDYRRACEGRTGIDGFDAWARELSAEGYLANHARMWFASIWIFTLGLPWELGADFFLRHLIDGDAASNTLSWRWVAGLHTPGKTYLARRANIVQYTAGRFDPQGLAPHAEPVAGFANPQPAPRRTGQRRLAGEAALLLTDEDLHPETLIDPGVRIVAIAGLSLAPLRSALGCSPAADAFAHGAMADALARAGAHFDAPAIDLTGAEDPVSAVADWGAQTGCRQIATAFLPVGWVRDALVGLAAQLAGRGMSLIEIERDWDHAFWPHATRGFFALGERIPATLAALGIPSGGSCRHTPNRRT